MSANTPTHATPSRAAPGTGPMGLAAWVPGDMGRRDWLLVAACAGLGEVFYLVNLTAWQAAGQLDPNPPWLTALIVILVIVQSLALLGRRMSLLAMFVSIYVIFIAVTVLQGSRDLAAGPALWVGVFFLAAQPRTRATIGLLVGAVVGDVAIQLPGLASAQELIGASGTVTVSAILIKSVVVYMVCALLGGWVALQRRRTELATERTELLAKGSQARINEALARERNAMARELHDIAAHHLSAMAIQAKAALLVHPQDPDAVAELLTDIRRQSQETLSSLRQIVGILRERGEAELAPEPGINDIASLVESVRNLGVTLTLAFTGDSAHVSPAASLAAYRVVQESLSNARRHATGAPITVTVATSEKVTVEIVNDPAPPRLAAATNSPSDGGRFGITGMRERVQLLGGRFESARTSEGGWRTWASIPATTTTGGDS